MDARTDFIPKEKNAGRENDERRLDESDVGAGESGVLCEPSRVRGDSVTTSLRNKREICWIDVPLGWSAFVGWDGAGAITSEELGVRSIWGNIPVTCFVKVAMAR